MFVPLWAVGLGYVAVGAGILLLLWKPISSRTTPGTLGFVLLIVTSAVSAIAEGLDLLVAGFQLSVVIWHVRIFAAAAVAVGWVLLAEGFFGKRTPSRRVRVVLFGYLVVFLAVLGVDFAVPPFELFLDRSATEVVGVTIRGAVSDGFWVHTAISYGLILYGTGLFITEAIRSTGLRRKQATVLVLGVTPPMTANMLIVFDIVALPYDLTPLGQLGSVLLFSWALYRMDLLDIAPVARKLVVSEMDDAIVTLDAEDRVVDCNAAARQLFGVEERTYFGLPAGRFFPSVPAETIAQLARDEHVETEISLPIGGESRYFSFLVSPIRTGDRSEGRVVVLRDVTTLKRREAELKSREEELDLVRQVFSRVLRHNLRNELTVIHGSADELAAEVDAPLANQAQLIRKSSEELLEISRKARQIERIVDRDTELADHDLRDIATSAAETVGQRHPTATIDVVGPDACRVRCRPELETAVENLLENAVKRSRAPTPSVRIEIVTDGGRPRLTVTGNGPETGREELARVAETTEAQLLQHSGVGLWLVRWIVDQSDATLSAETSSDGASVTIHFDQPAVESAAS